MTLSSSGYIIRDDWKGDSKISDADRQGLQVIQSVFFRVKGNGLHLLPCYLIKLLHIYGKSTESNKYGKLNGIQYKHCPSMFSVPY